MPTLITRAEALDRIRAEGNAPPCLMCAILAGRVGDHHVVAEDAELVLSLPRYVRRWGHAIVTPRQHLTRYRDVPPYLWARASLWAQRAAHMIEDLQAPRRVYVTSTGSSAGELLQSSMHVHIHVVPVYDADDRPADIFSWQEGVYVAERAEWEELRARYRAAWDALAGGPAGS
jgi:diadenosine tetraphosphate (Ap4A) HIT family hydrolase